jgi:hypothetical protein
MTTLIRNISTSPKVFDTDQIFQQDLGNEAIKQWTHPSQRRHSWSCNHAVLPAQPNDASSLTRQSICSLGKGCIERAQVKAYPRFMCAAQKRTWRISDYASISGDLTMRPHASAGLFPLHKVYAICSEGEKKPKYFAAAGPYQYSWQTMMHEGPRDHTAFINSHGTIGLV